MKLTGLKELYKSMKSQDIDRYKFDFIYNKVKFDVIFFIDSTPFVLMFGVKYENFYFEIKVSNGFEINPILLPDDYKRLVKILNLDFSIDGPFKISYFFQAFNNNIPKTADPRNRPKPNDIIIYKSDVEESDKIYFYGWLDNKIQNKKVTKENLEKTKTLLGHRAYERCKAKNISSRWTSDKTKEVDYYLPNFS